MPSRERKHTDHSDDVVAPQNGSNFGAKEVCRSVGISHRQLDYWVLIGVVTPRLERHGAKQFRRFSRQDVTMLQRIKKLTDEGVVVSRAAERVRRDMMHERGGMPAAAGPVEASDGGGDDDEYVPDSTGEEPNGAL